MKNIDHDGKTSIFDRNIESQDNHVCNNKAYEITIEGNLSIIARPWITLMCIRK